MKKYLYIFKSEMITSLQYVFNIIAKLFVYFLMIFIFIQLWQYIYSDPKEIINGYTMNQMIWYVMITEVLWYSLGGRKLCRKINEDVKGGNIAYNLNKPYNYIQFSLFSHLGEIVLRTILYILCAFLIGIIMLGEFPNLNIFSIIAVILTGILATVINTLLVIFVGLISFIMEDSSPLYWLYSKLILIVGTLFPIEFFPKLLQGVLKYSPIYVVSYGPAKLFVDFSIGKFISIIIAQIIYIIIAYALCMLIYKKGVKKLNVNGG